MYKAPPYMYDWVLNASLLLGELYYPRLFQQHKSQRKNNTLYYNLNYNSILGSKTAFQFSMLQKMLNAVTVMTDAMSGQTVGNAATILNTCMSGVEKGVNYAAENSSCHQDKHDIK